MKTEILSACDHVLAGAANGVYQGIIITAAVALGLRMLGRTNAATRHAVWFCTLLLLICLIAAHCLIGTLQFTSPTKAHDTPTVLHTGLGLPVPVAATLPETEITPTSSSSVAFLDNQTRDLKQRSQPGHEWMRLPSSEAPERGTQENAVGNGSSDHTGPGRNELSAESGIGQLASARVSGEAATLRQLAERFVSPVSLNLSPGFTVPKTASMILLAFWLAIGSARVFVLLLQLHRIQKLKLESFPPSTELSDLFQKLAPRFAVNRKVQLKVSPAHRSSFLLGFLHPVILLPAEERMEPGEAELVLRHELAHLGRRDDWANLVQQLIMAAFFFHPAVWWISKQLSLEREIACDDHVLQQSRHPQAYALLLANLATRMQRRLPLLAPGSSNNKTQLKQRIDMILDKHRNTSPRLAKSWLAVITSAAALFAVAIISSAPRIVLAQNETAPTTAPAAPAEAPASGTATIAVAAEPDGSESADTVSTPTAAPAAVGPGPKFKPGTPSSLDVPQTGIATPVAPSLPAVAATAVAPPVPPAPFLAAIEPTHQPVAPRSPRPVGAPRSGDRDSSLEERLERLEQMVESLVNEQHPRGRTDFPRKAEKEGTIDRKEIAKIEAFAKRQAEVSRKHVLEPEEIEKMKEQARREAGRAIEQSKRAALEADSALKAEQKLHTARKFKEGSQKQIEALRKQLEMLEREREKLDRQIEQLQDQEQLDDQRDEDQAGSTAQSTESKPECVVDPAAPR